MFTIGLFVRLSIVRYTSRQCDILQMAQVVLGARAWNDQLQDQEFKLTPSSVDRHGLARGVRWVRSPQPPSQNPFHFVSFFVFYFNNCVKCPCNVIHDGVTLIFTFLIIIIIIMRSMQIWRDNLTGNVTVSLFWCQMWYTKYFSSAYNLQCFFSPTPPLGGLCPWTALRNFHPSDLLQNWTGPLAPKTKHCISRIYQRSPVSINY